MARVLYFASARDLTGKDYDDVDIAKVFKIKETVPLDTLLNHIEHMYPKKNLFEGVMFAVNDEYCDRSGAVEVRNSDEVVIIPPVSGG
ncbi:hypothetical protein IWW55_005489, partial [Coemansia sp. RSA 2706]